MLIQEKALLVKLSISLPGTARKDKNLTSKVKTAEHLGESAGRWLKQLWPDIALEPLTKLATTARQYHYEHSLPWCDDGMRILPTIGHGEYSNVMRGIRNEFEQLAESHFIARYDEWIEWARVQHNGSFDASEYPEVTKLRRKFGFFTDYAPIPSGEDFRVGLSAEELDTITKDLDGRVERAVKAAQADLWQRLSAPLQAMVERLADPKATFRDTLVGNLREIVALIPTLNLTEDPALADFAKQAEELAKPQPETLRKDLAVRKDTADKAAEILRKMRDYMPQNA